MVFNIQKILANLIINNRIIKQKKYFENLYNNKFQYSKLTNKCIK